MAKQLDRPVKKTFSLRESIVEQVEITLRDPFTDEPAYGSWSGLLEELLTMWLEGKVKTSLAPLRLDLSELIPKESP